MAEFKATTEVTEKKRILIAHPPTENYSEILKYLEDEKFNIQEVTNTEELLHKVQAWPPHLLLITETMSSIAPLDLINRVQQAVNLNKDESNWDQVLSAVLIEKDEPEFIAALLDGGADEVFATPINLTILGARLRSMLRKRSLFEKIKRFNNRVNELSIRDELTGLYKMSYVQERLNQEIARSRRTASPLSCIILDLDNIKKLIDQFDHAMANEIIGEIGAVIIESTRQIDVCGHHGGDEFIILLPDTGIESAKVVAQRLRSSINHQKFKGGRKKVSLTACFGISTVDHLFQDDGGSVLRRAERALHEAKKRGSDTISIDQ